MPLCSSTLAHVESLGPAVELEHGRPVARGSVRTVPGTHRRTSIPRGHVGWLPVHGAQGASSQPGSSPVRLPLQPPPDPRTPAPPTPAQKPDPMEPEAVHSADQVAPWGSRPGHATAAGVTPVMHGSPEAPAAQTLVRCCVPASVPRVRGRAPAPHAAAPRLPERIWSLPSRSAWRPAL